MIGNVHPKKYLGQHFLIDENISKKIIDSVNFSKYDKVVEVGPGKVLQGLNKRIDRSIVSQGIDSITKLEQLNV